MYIFIWTILTICILKCIGYAIRIALDDKKLTYLDLLILIVTTTIAIWAHNLLTTFN